jgi:hypothetical protein
MNWNRPRHPQENARVERAHGTVKQWVEAATCQGLSQLQQRLDRAVVIQREQYPTADGYSRSRLHPQLLEGGRPYHPEAEEESWSLARVCEYLSQGIWQRRVSGNGQVSLYNRNYTAGKRVARQQVSVRFEAVTREWVMMDERGNEVRRHHSLEISKERICCLEVTRRKVTKCRKGA